MFTSRKKALLMQLPWKAMIIVNVKNIATEKSINTYLNLVHELDINNHFGVYKPALMFYHQTNMHTVIYIHRDFVEGGGITNCLPIVNICFVAFSLKMHCYGVHSALVTMML